MNKMCIICVDLIKQSMTIVEAQRNAHELGHIEHDPEARTHYQDLHDAIYEMDLDKIDKLLNEGELNVPLSGY